MKRFSILIGALLLLGAAAVYNRHPAPEEPEISAVVVPHHDIVSSMRASLFTELQAKRPTPATVILVSPNHYESGTPNVQTSTETWTTQEGDIEPQATLIQSLIDAKLATASPGSFSNEHGIKNILGDIERTYPTASIVPLILRMNTTQSEVSNLNNFLTANCTNCLLIASVDFSHYQPAPLADLHDKASLRGLFLRDRSVLQLAETDSPASLSLLAAWATSHQTDHFNLWNHTNSSTLANTPDILGTSHIFGWYERGSTAVPPTETTFSIGSAPASFPPTDRAIWGTDLRLLLGEKQPRPMRPGEVTLTNAGFLTWDNRKGAEVSLSTPLPTLLVQDQGDDRRFGPSEHAIVVVDTLERAKVVRANGADLVVSLVDLGTTDLNGIPVVSGLTSRLVSGTIQPRNTQITSHILLQNQP